MAGPDGAMLAHGIQHIHGFLIHFFRANGRWIC